MNHPDFRIGGKIFASLGYPDDEHGMVKLTPDQQRTFLKKAPSVFFPCAGAWGRNGATSVRLAAARATVIRTALKAASQNVAPRRDRANHPEGPNQTSGANSHRSRVRTA